jgi:ribose-phosphate pyrophosphokinase
MASKSGKRPYEYYGTPISLVTIKELLPLAERLAQRLCSAVGVDTTLLEPIIFETKFFADGELMARKPIDAALRETRVLFLDCPRFPTINDGMMNTVLTLDAIAGAGAQSITHIPLYLPYARQDKRKPGEPLSWIRIAKMFKHATPRLDRMIAVELHTEQHEGAFDTLQFSQIRGHRIFAEHFAAEYRERANDVIIVSPDAGGVERAKKFADKLFPDGHHKVGHTEKERPADNVSEVVSYSGPEDIAGKTVFIYDDIIDTGGTISGAAELLKSRGAAKVIAVSMHGLFNGDALRKMQQHGVDHVVTSESIPRTPEWMMQSSPLVIQVPLDDILAKVILEQRPGGSVSKIFL